MARASRLKSSKELMDAEQYYCGIIDCLPNIVYVLDKNCSLTHCNKNFYALLGLPEPKDILGVPPYKKMISLAHWSEERVALFKKDDIQALLSEEPLLNRPESPVVKPNGDILYFQSSRSPLFNKNKEVIGLVCILIDITEHKKMAEQLSKMKEHLQYYNTKKEEGTGTKHRNKPLFSEKKPPKVLMVEDNTTAQKAAQALLMQLDCQVDVADSGDKATTLFSPGKYDLVFMDIGLEDTSGYMVAKKIRQLEKGTQHHVPIIALTGYQADIVKYDCDDYSMEGALTKPLTHEQAKQIIQHYIYHLDIPVRGLKSIKTDMS